MDAHVFRLAALELARFMRGGRVEKIFSPAPGLLALTVYNFGLKRIVTLRHEKSYNHGLKRVTNLKQRKDTPCIYLTDKKLPNPEKPSTLVMTLRKYISGRKLGAATADWLNRRIFFYLPQERDTSAPLWFCLDLVTGPSLQSALPPISPPAWPDMQMLGPDHHASLRDESLRKHFPVLTPALRRTLLALASGESAALLADLACESEQNTGSLYLYSLDGAPRLLSAWPLPEETRNSMDEKVIASDTSSDTNGTPACFAMLEAARAVCEPAISAFLEASLQKEHRDHEKSSAGRLRKTLLKLDEEEKRLGVLLALREQAILIQSQLWRYGQDEKLTALRISAQDSPCGSEVSILLDGLKTLRENMAYMFKQSARGARGLEIVQKRRKELAAELQAVENGLTRPVAAAKAQERINCEKQKNSGRAKNQEGRMSLKASFSDHKGIEGETRKNHREDQDKNPARLVQAFTSSDGFTLLRGKSAAGNHALLKLAQAHDLWLHVQGGPSAHVIIRRTNPGVQIPETTLLEAGTLSALKSWRKNDDKAEIITALVKDIRPVKGGAAGSVLVEKQLESLIVKIDPAIEARLSQQAEKT